MIIIIVIIIMFMIFAILTGSIAVITHVLAPFSYSVPLNQLYPMSRYSFCSQD
jgi:hypothetical protein